MDANHIPGFLFVDHIAIAVKPGDLGGQLALYGALGFLEVHREDMLGGDQVREVLLQVGGSTTRLQLLEPLTPDSPIARLIDKRGGRGGLAHVAFAVADIHRAYEYLKALGFAIIDPAPRKGSRGSTVFFVHPKITVEQSFGYLMEIVQV